MVGGVEILEGAKKGSAKQKSDESNPASRKNLRDLICLQNGTVYYVDSEHERNLRILYRYIFRGYTFGTGDAIVKGGRYDHLVEKFGKAEPAIGFAIVVDELMSALSRQKIQISSGEKSSLILYDKERLKDAIQLPWNSEERTRIPDPSEASDKSLEFYVDYGKRSLAGSMLYLRSKGDVQMVNLMTGEEKIVG